MRNVSMRIVTITIIINLFFLSITQSKAQDWEWSLSAKPDIESGISDICMLADGMTGWAVGSDAAIGRIFHTSDGWKTWVDQTDTLITKLKFKDVSFVDELNGWVVGADGIILHTVDGGDSWQNQGAGVTTEDLKELVAVDANNVYASGSKGTIIYTNDGNNWSSINTETTEDLFGIDMFDVNHGIAVGMHETILYTTDGLNWMPASSVPNIGGKDFNAVRMADQNTAWLVGDGFATLPLKSVFAKTTDGGDTWTLWEPTESIMQNMWGIDFTAPTKGVAVGHKGLVFVTTDGNEWTVLQRQFGNKSNGVAIIGDKIWAVGDGGTIHYADDFGSNWFLLPDVIGTNLYKIGAADDNRIIAIGYASSLTKTNDGGANWESGSVVADNTVTSQLWGIDFATSDIGWVSGSEGFIAKTIDGSGSWTLQGENVTGEWLRSILAYNENVVWVVGNNGTILKTTDSGDTWVFQGSGITSRTLYDIDAWDENRLAIVGDKSTFLYTGDGGKTWQESVHDLTGEKKLTALRIVDETHTWAVGSDGIILFSSDVGANWSNQSSPTTADLDGIYFKDASSGWIVGEGGFIFETSDGGSSWKQVASGVTEKDLKSIIVTDDGKVFACGYSGVVVRYGPVIGIAVENESTEIITQFRLCQNYPNPFNPTTSINYHVPICYHVNITVYNQVGQKVITLVDETKSAGSHQISWNAENLPTGIYFVKMTTREFSDVRKLLLVK